MSNLQLKELLSSKSIRNFREKELKMTQRELAAKLGVGVSTFSRWEKEGVKDRNPSTGAIVLAAMIAKTNGLIKDSDSLLDLALGGIVGSIGIIATAYGLYGLLKWVFEKNQEDTLQQPGKS